MVVAPIVRPQGDCPPNLGNAFGEMAALRQNQTQHLMGSIVSGLQSDGRSKFCDRRVSSACILVKRGHGISHRSVVAVEAQGLRGLIPSLDRPIEVSAFAITLPVPFGQSGVGPSESGVLANGPL